MAEFTEQQHYTHSVDFFEQFDSDTFEREVQTDTEWHGYVRNDSGAEVLAAKYVHDAGSDSGTGYVNGNLV